MSINGREVIFEFSPIGNAVRVTAMDTQTKIEIVMQAPASSSESIIKRNALKKLEYVLRKKGKL